MTVLVFWDIDITGDTLNDIASDRANQACTIGFARGRQTMPVLVAAGAEYVAPSLADTDQLLAQIPGYKHMFDRAG